MKRAPLLALLLLGACDVLKPQLIREAETAVRDGMLDPDAGQFKDVVVCDADKNVVQGEANGKNAFGAYTGFKSFYYSNYRVAWVEDPDFTPLMERCFGPEIMAKVHDLTSDKDANVTVKNALDAAGAAVKGDE